MENIIKSIQKTLDLVDNTTNLFYQGKLTDGYIFLEESLSNISTTMGMLLNYEGLNKEIESKIFNLNEVLVESMKALENKDIILLSDIFQYDLKELLEQLIDTLRQR